MTDKPIFRIDEAAVLKGGEAAGQYLDKLGKTDLAQLSRDQWITFLSRVVGGAMAAAVGDVWGVDVPF